MNVKDLGMEHRSETDFLMVYEETMVLSKVAGLELKNEGVWKLYGKEGGLEHTSPHIDNIQIYILGYISGLEDKAAK